MLHATIHHIIAAKSARRYRASWRIWRKKAFNLEGNMLGIDDPWIWGVYLLCILSALLCLIYGVVNWNREGDQEALEVKEEEAWEKSEEEMQEKELGL
jgi:hypothetical protein